ncbi:nodulation competitiveness protein NfeD [Sulfurihydrogenibium azorense Az-Fu1]|uniref:Nodulation competitiveness protein NfeD n=1 Tax=Sulfurihydrogenibium azorense (strain DSM 15241 / OCM 825 / Az-Fu1) TaxID=204536 RepID=C1DTI8_SULAA|nr:nodulation protein NfeD [Sulfurihydrogenibium azorense]ACN98298.1 nodulation competitiveness protein NfeD [Sulfurihydrogenibium azorense Az-Fu1]
MKKFLVLLLLFIFKFSFAEVFVGKWNDAITPTTVDYVKRLVEKAERENGKAVILMLDTPGGLDTSMREIIKIIQNTSIPFVVFVYPPGSRAASAGAIITVSADIAAMAPSTNIGSASPVSMEGRDIEETMKKKVVNDMVAFVSAIAKEKGRNSEIIQKMITESVNLPSDEAVNKKVVDLVAKDLNDLIDKINGKKIVKNNREIILNLKGDKIVFVEKSFKEELLSFLSNPTVAYFLLMIGFYGIFFELYNPGSIIPGTVGLISLALALYSLNILSVNWLGVVLIGLGILFFILEAITPLFGGLALAGTISILLGSIILLPSDSPYGDLSLSVIIPVVLFSAVFFFIVSYLSLKVHKEKPKTGIEAMVGDIAEVVSDIDKKGGKVMYHGELWNAYSDKFIPAGSKVKIVEVNGLKLKVEEVKE